MTPTHAAAVLRQLTDWRRGVAVDPPNPGEVLEAIDAAIAMIDRLEAAEKERDALRNEIVCVKEVEFPRKAQAVADAWKGKCKRLEAERDALRALVVMRFDHDRPPQFTQGYDTHELTEPVTAEHCRWFVDEIERLRAKIEAAEKSDAESLAMYRRARDERDALRAALQHEADCVEACKSEIERLRAKIQALEKQEPAGYGVLYVEPTNGEEDWDSIWKHRVFAEDHVKDFVQAYSDLGESVGAITVVPLYAFPGAKGE